MNARQSLSSVVVINQPKKMITISITVGGQEIGGVLHKKKILLGE
jgi:hypothetical protein